MPNLPVAVDLSGAAVFQRALVVGVVIAIATAACALAVRRSGSRPSGILGPAWVIGTLLTIVGWTQLRDRTDLRWQVVAGLALVFAGAETATRLRTGQWNMVLQRALLVPGAVLLGYGSGFDAPVWLPGFIVLGTVFLAPFVADFDRRTSRLGLGPVLFTLALFGLQLNLTHRDLVLVALGVAIPLVLLAIPFGICRLGNSGSIVAVALFLWLIAEASNDLPVQTWVLAAALGLLITEPMGRRLEKAWRRRQILHHRPARSEGIAERWPTVGVQAAVIFTQLVIVLYVCLYAGDNLTLVLHRSIENGGGLLDGLRQAYAKGYDVNIWTMILRVSPAVILGVVFGRFFGLSRGLRHRALGSSELGSSEHSSHGHSSNGHSSNGHSSNGRSSNGHRSHGHTSREHASRRHR